LDLAPLGVYTAAGNAYIAQEQLQKANGTGVLGTVGKLG
jgi:hypothetical protein